MQDNLLKNADFLENVINAIPSIIFVVDSEIRIQQMNSTAGNSLGLNIHDVYEKRGGDAFHCIHSSEAPGGCGKAAACGDCVIRDSVNKAFQGEEVCRKQTRMKLKTAGTSSELHLLITTSPFEFEQKRYVLLTLDDISELIQLRSILPICASCKKIRNDKEYWETIENYISTRIDVNFSHGICPNCAKKLYPDLYKELI